MVKGVYLGCFWNRQFLASFIAKNNRLTTQDAALIIDDVEHYSHNILSDGIANYNVTDAQLAQVMIIENKIAKIISHKISTLVIYGTTHNLLRDTATGETHNQVKFNPIDNNNTTANLIVQDNVIYNLQDSITRNIQLQEVFNGLLGEIDSELQGMCIKSFSLDDLDNTYCLDITGIFAQTDLGEISAETPQALETAILELNPLIGFINKDMIDYFVFVNFTENSCELYLSADCGLYDISQPITFTYTIAEQGENE